MNNGKPTASATFAAVLFPSAGAGPAVLSGRVAPTEYRLAVGGPSHVSLAPVDGTTVGPSNNRGEYLGVCYALVALIRGTFGAAAAGGPPAAEHAAPSAPSNTLAAEHAAPNTLAGPAAAAAVATATVTPATAAAHKADTIASVATRKRPRAVIVTDSNLVIQTLTKWLPNRKKKHTEGELKNLDLVLAADKLLEIAGERLDVQFRHIRSHTPRPKEGGDPVAAFLWRGNNAADGAAGSAAEKSFLPDTSALEAAVRGRLLTVVG